MLVLHYTGMESARAAVDRLCDPSSAVSAHYVVDTDGGILQLVDEYETAWHAGVSCWRGRSALNDVSVGVEVVNGGHDFGLPPYPAAQVRAVADLAAAIAERWHLSAANIVGHSDVAPMRKRDPGERFPWHALAARGIGLWPEPGDGGPSSTIPASLAAIGYGLDDAPQPTSVTSVIQAFQRRFQAARPIDGRDSEALRRRLAEVAHRYVLASRP